MKGLVLVCAVIGIAKCTVAPFITPCHEKDDVCLKASAERVLPVIVAGIPSMGISNLDPMHMEQVKTSQAGLDMDFRNTEVTGLKHCKVLKLKRQGNKIYLDLKCSVNMVGDYTLGGKLLIMPIQGNGKYSIKIRDIVVKILLQVGEKIVDGEKYWTLKSWKHTSEVLKNVHFQFQNLFNGNQQLGDTVTRFANENWRDIFHEVAPPIVKAIVDKIVGETSKLFENVPLKDMVL